VTQELTFSKLTILERTTMSMVAASFRSLLLATVLRFSEEAIFHDITFFPTKTVTDNYTNKHMPQSCQLTKLFICFDISVPAIHQRSLFSGGSYINHRHTKTRNCCGFFPCFKKGRNFACIFRDVCISTLKNE